MKNNKLGKWIPTEILIMLVAISVILIIGEGFYKKVVNKNTSDNSISNVKNTPMEIRPVEPDLKDGSLNDTNSNKMKVKITGLELK